MRALGWVVVGFLSLAFTGGSGTLVPLPEHAPRQRQPVSGDPVIKLRLLVDEELVARHREQLHAFLHEAVAVHNLEWRRLRREWFTISEVIVEPPAEGRDALYLLVGLLHQTVQEPGTVHVRISGQPLEIYSSGVSVRSIGGLAFRGSDVVVVSAAPGVTADLLAYYLFHEIGHLWDAFDLPFGGGHSTFGTKKFATFDVDAGNSQIMEDSPGPRPRDTPLQAPAVIRAKLAAARAAVRDPAVYRRLHDLLLHEPSPVNPAYVAKREALLAAAGSERAAVAGLLDRFETRPQQTRANREVRRELAEQYWIANDAIARGDLATAETALATIETLHAGQHGDTRVLISAVGKKVRRTARR
ncbi:MAG TPA: hypothetical protein VNA04_03470 [Thermoanaerobaculia bacterium]|nr:hypothetical protein [Thermoanaerobaculia bacterium]